MGMFDLPQQQLPMGPSPMDQARLSPQQGAAFLSAQGGQQLGSAAAGMARGALGMPNDMERMQAVRAEVARRTQGMTDQVEILKVAVQVLSQFGFPEQAAAAAKQLEETANKRRDDERMQKRDDATAEVARRKAAVLERGTPEQQLIQRYSDELAKLDKLTPTTPEHERQKVLVREIGNRLAKQNIQVKDAGGFLQVFVEGQPMGTVEKTVDPNVAYKADSLLEREAMKATNDPTKKVEVKGKVDGQGRQIYQDKTGALFVMGPSGWESAEGKGDLKTDTSDATLSPAIKVKVAANEGLIDGAANAMQLLAKGRDHVGIQAYGNKILDLYDRWDQAGVPVRAAITNLMSDLLHARSGAAVTVQEFDRLRGFLPQPTDPGPVAMTKLQGMRDYAITVTNALRRTDGKPEKAYAPVAAGGAPAAKAAPAQSTAVARPKDKAAYDALPSGTAYVDPRDGKTYRKP